jgi:hypothetical protein
VKREGKFAVLLVGNPASRNGNSESALGLGLRVVAALLRIEPELQFQRWHGQRYHLARLLLPVVKQPGTFNL